MFLLVAGTVAGAPDTMAPVVDVPEDKPGADVIVFLGDTYTFDASGSTDDVGIVNFLFEFNDAGIPVMQYTTTGTFDYTFTTYGQTWVVVHAWDRAGNEGLGSYSIDVAEKVTSSVTYQDTSAYVDHSLYITGDLTIDNSRVSIADGGAGANPVGGGGGDGAVDLWGESVTPGGSLSGHWEPDSYKNYWARGNPYNGYAPVESTNYVFTGDVSIGIESSSSYYRGFEYWFDEPADLTDFDMLSFWIRCPGSSSYPSSVSVYFYSSSTYSYPYYMYYNLYGGGYAATYGWYGFSVNLDYRNVGYSYNYGVDMSYIHCIRFYMYCYRYGPIYIDNVGIYSIDELGDDITESSYPSGDKAGYWYNYGGSVSTSTRRHTGSYSVAFSLPYTYNYYTFGYRFNNPQDLSEYDGLRFLTYWGSYRYLYWYDYCFYVTSANGGYGYFYTRSNYFNYYSQSYGFWYQQNLPWGKSSYQIYSWNLDWTQVNGFEFWNIYNSGYTGTCYVDALEWVKVGAGGPPTDNVPVSIYVDGGDTTITDSTVGGAGKLGGRIVNWGGTTTLKTSTFDNIWHTEHEGVNNAMHSYGGVEVYGDADIDNVAFTNCMGTGLALFDGDWTLDVDTIDLSGAALKAMGAPKVIMGLTDRSTGAHTMDVSGWWAEGSLSGTGIMVMLMDTTASVTVDVHDNHVSSNKMAGIVISNMGTMHASPFVQGGIANLDLTIRDQLIEDAGAYGIYYYVGHGEWSPNTVAKLTVDNVTVRGAGIDGMMIHLDMGAANVDATIMNSSFERNSGAGIAALFSGFFGKASIYLDNVVSMGNSESGLEFEALMAPYNDGKGHVISPVSTVEVLINGTMIKENSGWGIWEHFNGNERTEGGAAPPWNWNGPIRNTLSFNVTMDNSFIQANQMGGWASHPEEGWIQGNYWIHREIYNSDITDNRGDGVYLEPNHDMWGGEGTVEDVFMFDTCRITDNVNAFNHYLGYDNYGYYSEAWFTNCRLADQDAMSIAVHGPTTTDGVNYWGLSRVLGTYVHVDGCRITNMAEFSLLGADDSGHPSWDASMGVTFTNNIVDVEDEVIEFLLGSYQWCNDFKAYGEIANNRFYRGYPMDGVRLDMFGGWNLEMDMTIRDYKITSPGGSGINIATGTMVNSAEPHQVFGMVMLDNVTITNAAWNGLNFTTAHKSVIGGKSRGVVEAHDVNMDGVAIGIVASDLTGNFYHCNMANVREYSADLKYCLFNFYSCDVGEISTSNIKLLTKGAAKMWYDVDVDVKWASGQYVIGAVVSVQDNTFATIGVNTVSAAAPVAMGYINSYTVLPDTVYSKSPYLVSANFLGLSTDNMVDVTGDMVVNLILVDDVLPRLTVNKPLDGSSQTRTSMEVRGHAWDMHSGLETVMVSVDDFNWYEAEGSPDFSYTFDTVPEGHLILMVKAIDFAGNERMEMISVLVDATPPSIIIIEPKNDVLSTQNPMLSVIGVTELGARVKVNNEDVTLEFSMFHTTVTLREGYNEVRITSADPLGNTASHVIQATLDTIAPPLIVTSPESDSVVGDRRVTVTGQTETGAMVYVDGKVVANVDGEFSTRLTLSEGLNVIVVMAKDAVGNSRTVKVPVRVDTQNPWLHLISPMDGQVFGISGILVSGWVEAGSSVLVNDQPVTVTEGYFSTYVFGSEGSNIIKVEVIDAAGNSMAETVDVVVDTTAPSIRLDSPEDGTMTADERIEIVGQLSWDDREDFRSIILLINGEFMPFAENGAFRSMYDLAEGTNPLFIRVEDAVGNSATISLTVVRDTKAPFLLAEATPTFNHPVWNKPATYRSLVYIEGLTEPGATVTVDGAEVTVDDEGYFNVSILLAGVPEKEKLVQRSVVVMATDGAGNSQDTTLDIYRLKEKDTDRGFGDYEDTQYYVLFLSLVILVLAILFAAIMWKRMGAAPEEELYEEEV